MNPLTFTFCGADAIEDFDLIVNDITIPITPEMSETTQDIPGMVGKIFLGNSYGQKIFKIDVTIQAKDSIELTSKIHDLTELVMTFGSGEYPMTFSIDPGYTYYGHFTNISEPQRIIQNSSYRKVTLTFACSDPKGYGDYVSNDMTANPVSLQPLGRSECYPIFTCLPKKDVSKIAVADNEGNYVFLGAGVDPSTGDSPQNLEPQVLHDNCNDLTPWTVITAPTFGIDNGVISGSFRAGNEAFTPSDFGGNSQGHWHGPMIQRWLPGSYQDYRIRARMLNYQIYPRATGKVVLYLLNSDGQRIGKLELSDDRLENREVTVKVELGDAGGHPLYWSGGTVNRGKSQIAKTIQVKNGTKTVKSKGKTITEQLWKTINLVEDTSTDTFTNFYGYIELQKIGNKYRVEIMHMTTTNNPGWSKPIVVTWTDNGNAYTNNAIAGVALYCAKYDNDEDTMGIAYTNDNLQLTDLTVDNIINGGNSPDKPEIIARAGDEVKINCEDHRVYKNGGYFMEKLYIGSQFFKMNGGVYKTFAFEPGLNDADWYVEYTPTTS